ncbi:hypothetical protein ASG44_07155 [Methylophilus sp. Leaf459]|nr:hypothetical protein ASG44_07155 [Methylophilus sp. Leaf459]
MGNFDVTTRTFALSSGNTIEVTKRGCAILGATFRNTSDKNISLINGTLLTVQKETNATLEQYMLSCSPVLAGGSSKCMVHLLMKDADRSKYGGLSCPNIDIKIINLMVK